jgi:hypothetical protein
MPTHPLSGRLVVIGGQITRHRHFPVFHLPWAILLVPSALVTTMARSEGISCALPSMFNFIPKNVQPGSPWRPDAAERHTGGQARVLLSSRPRPAAAMSKGGVGVRC